MKEYLKTSEYCVRVTDGTHDTPLEVSNGHALITSKNIKNGRIVFDKAYSISDFDYNEINKRSKVERYDILFTMIGTVGEICIVYEEPVFAIKNIGLFKSGGDIVKAKWLYYYLSSDKAKEYISSRNKGTTQGYITLDDLRNFPIWNPPYETQKEIAHILGTLDDKIELNRKMNKTLEEIAQALFKHWFIDFEFPNNDGKPYKSSGGAMIDSELGTIPQGWKVGKITDIAKVVGGATPSTKEPNYWNGDIPFVTPKDLTGIPSYFLLNTERKITKAGADCVSSGILPQNTILLSSRAPIGYLAILSEPSVINQGFIGLKCTREEQIYFMLLWIKNNLENIKQYANGSTFLEINKENFRKIDMLLPIEQALTEFNTICFSLFNQIKQLAIDNYILEEVKKNLLNMFFG